MSGLVQSAGGFTTQQESVHFFSRYSQITHALMALQLGHVITTYLGDDTNVYKHLPFVMDILVNSNIFTQINESNDSGDILAVRRKWSTRLNSLLQSKDVSARWAAISLIKVTCERSKTLLTENIQTWSSQLLGLILKPKREPIMINKATIQALSLIYASTADKPELQRVITTPNLPRFNQALIELCQEQELLPVALTALKTNFHHFPTSSRHVSDICTKICFSSLSGMSDLESTTLDAINHCIASLYLTSSKSQMAEQWKEMLLRVCRSVHFCLDRLFDTVDEEFKQTDLAPGIPFSDIPSDFNVSFAILVKRVHSLVECISVILSTKTNISVSVPVVPLIDLMCRIYNVYEGSTMRDLKDGLEYASLMSCLPMLHTSANKLFGSLLYSSGAHLSRYYILFNRILLRLLAEYKHQRTLRVSVYSLISLVLQTPAGYAFGEAICKPLSTCFLSDVRIDSKEDKPSQNVFSKQKSKKRKHEVTDSDALVTANTTASTPYEVQVAALDTLQNLLAIYGSSMNSQIRTPVDSLIISRLLMMTQCDQLSKDESLVKQRLYGCLLASIMHPTEVQASVLPLAIRIFSAGMNEQNHQLRTACMQGLAVCNLITHPRVPPLQQFAPQVPLSPPNDAENLESMTVEDTSMSVSSLTAVPDITKSLDEPLTVPVNEKSERITPEATPEHVMEATLQSSDIFPTPQQQPITFNYDAKKETTIVETTKNSTDKAIKKTVEKIVEKVIEKATQETADEATEEATEKLRTTRAVAPEESDEDLELPDIDMTGPDSGEEDE